MYCEFSRREAVKQSTDRLLNSKLYAKERIQHKLWVFVEKEVTYPNCVQCWWFRNSACLTKESTKLCWVFCFDVINNSKVQRKELWCFLYAKADLAVLFCLRIGSYEILNSEYQSELFTASTFQDVMSNQNLPKCVFFCLFSSGNSSTFNRIG